MVSDVYLRCERIMASASYGSEESGDIIGCAGDYTLMQIGPAADGGSSDSSDDM